MKLNRRKSGRTLGISALGASAIGLTQSSAFAQTPTSGAGSYVLIGTVEYDGQHGDRIKGIMLAHRKRVLEQDEGAVQFDIVIDGRAPGRMYLYEV